MMVKKLAKRLRTNSRSSINTDLRRSKEQTVSRQTPNTNSVNVKKIGKNDDTSSTTSKLTQLNPTTPQYVQGPSKKNLIKQQIDEDFPIFKTERETRDFYIQKLVELEDLPVIQTTVIDKYAPQDSDEFLNFWIHKKRVSMEKIQKAKLYMAKLQSNQKDNPVEVKQFKELIDRFNTIIKRGSQYIIEPNSNIIEVQKNNAERMNKNINLQPKVNLEQDLEKVRENSAY